MEQIALIINQYFFYNFFCLYALNWLVVPITNKNWFDRLIYLCEDIEHFFKSSS